MERLFSLSAVFFSRGVAALGGILISLVLARQVGADGLGMFTLFLSYLGIAALLMRRGLETIMIREVATLNAEQKLEESPALLSSAFKTVVYTSVFSSIPGYLILINYLGFEAFKAFVLVISTPILAFLAVVAGYFKGRGQAWAAPYFEVGGISFILAALVFFANEIGLNQALTMIYLEFFVVLVVMYMCAIFILKGQFPSQGMRLKVDVARLASGHNDLKKGQLAFLGIGLSSFLIQAGSFALAGPFLEATEIGYARAAERLALIISFPVLAINPFIASRIVKLYRLRDSESLKKLINSSILIGIALVFPVFLYFTLLPVSALSLFGEEFKGASDVLIGLSFVSLVVVVFGPYEMVLSMCDGQKNQLMVSLVVLAFATALYPLLCSKFGLAGFVYAYAATVVCRAVAIAYFGRIILMREFSK